MSSPFERLKNLTAEPADAREFNGRVQQGGGKGRKPAAPAVIWHAYIDFTRTVTETRDRMRTRLLHVEAEEAYVR